MIGPGSFIEVKKVLPLLTGGDEGEPTFDVVAPSLPNFGFSGGISKVHFSFTLCLHQTSDMKQKGFGLAQYAESMHALMTRLGYREYSSSLALTRSHPPEPSLTHRHKVIQGGDWGSFIARAMALRYPSHTKALPQTLGYALNDSPVGLLAWVYDKLHRWTDGYGWTDNEILEWVSIYLFSKAGPAASLRIYRESVTRPSSTASTPNADGKDGLGYTWLSRDEVISTRIADCVKIAVANFPGEIIQIPGTWLRAIGNIVRETEFEKGGHFAAWEAPEVLVQDLKAFVGRSGEAYGVVTNKDGF